MYDRSTETKKFIKIKCDDCGNEQIAFRNPSTEICCNVCGTTLIKPTGGKGLIRGQIVGEMT